jgi:hypothetical protein
MLHQGKSHPACQDSPKKAYLQRWRRCSPKEMEINLVAYVLFKSSQAAVRAEAVLRREGFPVRLVPVPRHLSAQCGTALSFDSQRGLAERIESRLREAGVPFASIHLPECRPVPSQEGGQGGP